MSTEKIDPIMGVVQPANGVSTASKLPRLVASVKKTADGVVGATVGSASTPETPSSKIAEIDLLRLRAASAELRESSAVVGNLEAQIAATPLWRALQHERQIQNDRSKHLDEVRRRVATSYGLPETAEINLTTGEISSR